VPSDPVSVAVALADKIDTLTGFWAIDEKPTGSKDPFALRRAALGVIRLVLGNERQVNLDALLNVALCRNRLIAELPRVNLAASISLQTALDVINAGIGSSVSMEELKEALIEEYRSPIPAGSIKSKWVRAVKSSRNALNDDGALSLLLKRWADSADLLSFFHDRLKVFLKDQGIRPDIIEACLAMPNNDDLTLLVKRAEALAAFLQSDDGTNLLQGAKRAANILAQAEAKDGVEYSFGADIKFAETESERALFAALDAANTKIAPAMAAEDIAAAMAAMAALRAPIDAFFTDVQVNADSEILRRNRLNLLHRIRALCAGVADFSKLEG
jgi:glycyl-tRNA synthetase beta chain